MFSGSPFTFENVPPTELVDHSTPVDDWGAGAKLISKSGLSSKPITGSKGVTGWQTSISERETSGVWTIWIIFW